MPQGPRPSAMPPAASTRTSGARAVNAIHHRRNEWHRGTQAPSHAHRLRSPERRRHPPPISTRGGNACSKGMHLAKSAATPAFLMRAANGAGSEKDSIIARGMPLQRDVEQSRIPQEWSQVMNPAPTSEPRVQPWAEIRLRNQTAVDVTTTQQSESSSRSYRLKPTLPQRPAS